MPHITRSCFCSAGPPPMGRSCGQLVHILLIKQFEIMTEEELKAQKKAEKKAKKAAAAKAAAAETTVTTETVEEQNSGNVEAFRRVSKRGLNVQREKLTPDVYAGKKLDNNYTFIAEVSDKVWKPKQESEIADGQRFIALANIEVLQTGRPTSVAVPAGFDNIPIGSYFIFKINGKGYSDVSVSPMTEEEAKKLIESDEVA